MSRLSKLLRNFGLLSDPRPPWSTAGRHIFAPPLSVDVDVDEAVMSALFDRVASVWSELGASEPYWSVLTNSIYRREKIDQTKDSFFKTAHWDVDLIEACLARAGLAEAAGDSCLELGCGVGRVTSQLANMFDRVVAVDVSAPHLRLAAKRIAMLGQSNVEFVHLKKVEDIQGLSVHDFFYSRLTLQHNPPPVMAHVLNVSLSRLSPGGLCLFQLPTYNESYQFDVHAYLASPQTGMEMHVLPQPNVHAILRRNAIELIEMMEGPTRTSIRNYMTFFGRKSPNSGSDQNP
ncbi:methyltransferase domain-containing protein [Anderseniella sp. Alg231-50]|uniref:methyltransferase domain-containing protein n=1 Tax=Anderseniella sp. Alg231-50 TaxID=1922226 RepID=UPI000D54F1C6